MNNYKPILISLLIILGLYLALFAADTNNNTEQRILSDEFKSYWFKGQAEISSFELRQARYGQYREGKAVLIFVTEPFLKDLQVKADKQSTNSLPVLKLNASRDFNTGIYPYHILSSVFYPLSENEHALKLTNTVTEWCGQSYSQLNLRSNAYRLWSHSYFETMADIEKILSKTYLEDELWTLMRVDPSKLPVGDIQLVPSLTFLRFMHQVHKPYRATISKITMGDSTQYNIHYPKLSRNLSIHYQNVFPYMITSWEESYPNGFGEDQKRMTTTAKRIKTIKSAYWSKNSNADVSLRDTLGL